MVLDDLVYHVADAMVDCLHLEAGGRVLVVHDTVSMPVAETIREAAQALGAHASLYNIDQHPRPLTRLPKGLASQLALGADATFYVAGVLPGELPFRSRLVREATRRGASHVHMPKATLEVLARVEGCRETAETVRRLHRALEGSRVVSVEAPGGTRIELAVGMYRWVADDGVIGRGEWKNWPPGEVYTTPTSAEGVIVVDGVLGSYFSTKYGLLQTPVRVEVSGGTIQSISGGPIAGELLDYLSREACGLRIGELGIGGNPRIKRPIGNMLHDEKMPGAHIAAGDPLGGRTGAPWSCPVHVDMLPLRSTVRAGTTTLVRMGELLV